MLATLRVLLAAALPVCLPLGMFVGLVDGARATVQTQPISGYTVTLEEVLITRNGASRLASVQTQALRADGATVLQLGPEGESARHIRLPSGLLIETNDRDKRMSTFHVSPDLVAGYVRNPQDSCRRPESEEVAGEEMVGRYRAARIVPRTGTSTRWYALDYSCAFVGSLVEHADGQKSETRLIALIAGPPSDALFETPDYVEGPPSALEAGSSCDPACDERRKRRDAEYYRLRRK